MKTMVCTGCSGNWACTVELGSDDLEPNRCIHDPKEDPYAEWLDTTSETETKMKIARAAMKYVRSLDIGGTSYYAAVENEKENRAEFVDLVHRLNREGE